MKTFVATIQLRDRGILHGCAQTQFSLAVNERSELVATSFGDLSSLITRANLGEFSSDSGLTRASADQVTGFFVGEVTRFTLPLAAVGSAFQHRVWAALQEIPFGETRSYGDLAKLLKSSPRAVGRANATNPICVVVPCHRVIGADGSLTGFAFGKELKQQLLDHERSFGRKAAAV